MANRVLLVQANPWSFSGQTAGVTAPDFADALESEGWEAFQTEDGRVIETEGV
jgi:hypothetical protein